MICPKAAKIQDAEVLHPDADWGEGVFSLLSWFRKDKVAAAKVMVVGCGALGNEVLKNLALFGIGHICLVDFDTVDKSNPSRSVLFRPGDVNRPKVRVAAERIREINPRISLLPIEGDISHDVGLGLIRDMDVVVGCVDSRWARYCINRLCMRAGKTWVDGGIDSLEGTARVFAPGKNCYACSLGPEARKEMSYRLSCTSVIRRDEAAGRVPTTPVIASIIGAVQAQEAMKIVHEEEVGRGELSSLCGKVYYYEGQHLTTRIAEFEAYDEDCPVHESWTPVLASDIKAGTKLEEALDKARNLTQTENLSLTLPGRGFVDYVVTKEDDRRHTVMLPDHKVEAFVEKDPQLRGRRTGALYQHEIKEAGENFPYSQLTLSQLGFPKRDILRLNTEKGWFYIEMNDEIVWK